MSSMYKPAPLRPKKTNITRARTGCNACKERRRKVSHVSIPAKRAPLVTARLKCDEKKPKCSACIKFGTPCEQAPRFKFRHPTCLIAKSEDEGMNTTHTNHNAPKTTDHRSEKEQSSASSFLNMEFIVSTGIPEQSEYYRKAMTVPQPLTPGRDAKYPIKFYSDAWKKLRLPILQEALLDPIFSSSTTVSEMVTALSACRLSRTQPERKMYKPSTLPGLCFRPDSGHETVSHDFYGSVMRRVAQWTPQDFEANPALCLAVLILFCYAESSMGTFKAYWTHSAAMTRLIQNYASGMLSAYPRGLELLAAWIEIEMQMWWRRLYFSTPDFQVQHNVLMLDSELQSALRAQNHRALVLISLCESQRLSNVAIISHWAKHTPNEHLSQRNTTLITSTPISEYNSLLETVGKYLDCWQAPSPIMGETAKDTSAIATSSVELEVHPLHFESHTAAMSYAYYVTARVLQCSGPLDSLELTDSSAISAAYEEAEAWIMVLLRVAAGIDWNSCIQLNAYSIGLSSLLLACTLRSRTLAIGVWIENWLQSQLKEGNFEEGSFPVFQTSAIIRLINREKQSGQDVLVAFQTEDDGGGRGKLGSYHSQLISSMLLFGRCRTTGRLYSYYQYI